MNKAELQITLLLGVCVALFCIYRLSDALPTSPRAHAALPQRRASRVPRIGNVSSANERLAESLAREHAQLERESKALALAARRRRGERVLAPFVGLQRALHERRPPLPLDTLLRVLRALANDRHSPLGSAQRERLAPVLADEPLDEAVARETAELARLVALAQRGEVLPLDESADDEKRELQKKFSK